MHERTHYSTSGAAELDNSSFINKKPHFLLQKWYSKYYLINLRKNSLPRLKFIFF